MKAEILCLNPALDEGMKKLHNEFMKRYPFFVYAGIVGSILLVFGAVHLAINRTFWFGRAQEGRTTDNISRENSYVFASPVKATADGASMIRVTVFLLDEQGLGISGQTVSLEIKGPVRIGNTQPITDTFGRAMFDVLSTSLGVYTVYAQVAGVLLPQTVSISFQ